jgi:hypothetical protein
MIVSSDREDVFHAAPPHIKWALSSGNSPSVRENATVRLYVSVPLPMETGMHAETLKNAKVAVFLNRSALCLLILPAACLVWTLHAYPPQYAWLLCLSLAIYAWPLAGVLFLVSAGFHTGTTRHRPKKGAGWRAAHGH